MNAIAFTAAALTGKLDVTSAAKRLQQHCRLFRQNQTLDAPEVRGDPIARAWEESLKPDTELETVRTNLNAFRELTNALPTFDDIVRQQQRAQYIS